MGRHISIFLSDELVEELDNYILANGQPKFIPLTPAEKKVVHEIADKKGVPAANAYLKTIRPPQPKLTRVTLSEYILEIGIQALKLSVKE